MDDAQAPAREQYRAICDFELAVFQMRFQTLAIFLAAVGFLIGLTHGSRATGALLLMLVAGLWVIDLRNRDLLRWYLDVGKQAEEEIFGVSALLFGSRPTRNSPVSVGLFNARVRIEQRHFGLVSFQVGIDIIFSGVTGYGVWVLVGRHGWYNALFFVPFIAMVLLAALTKAVQSWRKRKRAVGETPALG